MENVKKNKRQYSGFEKKEHQQGYLFLTPAIIILTIFIGLSVFYVVYLSFHKVNLFTKEYTFVGLQNYKRVLTDHIARIGLMNTLKFSLVVVPVQTVLALIISSVLNSNIKGKYFFRTVYFLPTLTSSSALTLIFMFMFNVSGPINKLLIDANLVSRGINFLQEPEFALKVIMMMNIWSTIPMYTTMYLQACRICRLRCMKLRRLTGQVL